MTDLVKRLRSHDYDHAYNLKTDEELYAERDEAADRIEQLEAALRYIYGNGDGRGCNPQLMINAAGAALGGKHE